MHLKIRALLLKDLGLPPCGLLVAALVGVAHLDELALLEHGLAGQRRRHLAHHGPVEPLDRPVLLAVRTVELHEHSGLVQVFEAAREVGPLRGVVHLDEAILIHRLCGCAGSRWYQRQWRLLRHRWLRRQRRLRLRRH